MSKTQRTKQASLQQSIDSLLQSLDSNYSAKRADANTEPGGYTGSSTHPSTKVDDNTEAGRTGSRASENEKDVKEDHGGPVSVDGAKEVPTGTAADDHYGIGMNPQATGDDPSNETSSAKATKDDPGSDVDARTDNKELNGGKYAEFRLLTKSAQDIGTELISAIANDGYVTSKAAAAAPATAAKTTPAKTDAKVAAAADVGADLAEAVTDASPDISKQALDNIVVNELAQIWLRGEEAAEKTAAYLSGRFAELKKRAEEGAEAPPAEGGGDPSGGGGGGDSEQQLMQLLQQGQSMGGGDAAAGMAGPGAGAAPAGPGADPAAGAGGGGASPEDLAMIQKILAETGITPEQLEQALTQQMAGGGAAPGGDPSGGMGAPPAGPDPAAGAGGPPADPTKAGWVAKTAAEKAKYAKAKDYILEICSRK